MIDFYDRLSRSTFTIDIQVVNSKAKTYKVSVHTHYLCVNTNLSVRSRGELSAMRARGGVSTKPGVGLLPASMSLIKNALPFFGHPLALSTQKDSHPSHSRGLAALAPPSAIRHPKWAGLDGLA